MGRRHSSIALMAFSLQIAPPERFALRNSSKPLIRPSDTFSHEGRRAMSAASALGVDAFDVPVHGPQARIVDGLAGRHAFGAGIVDDRSGEGIDRPIHDAVLDRL